MTPVPPEAGLGFNRFDIIQINRRTLNIRHLLASINPLIRKTRYLAFNAKFTVDNLHMRGGAFSVLVKELNGIINDLDELLVDVGQVSWEMASSASRSSQSQKVLSMYAHALDKVAVGHPQLQSFCHSLLVGNDWLRELAQNPTAQHLEHAQPGSAEDVLLRAIQTVQESILAEFSTLSAHCRRLTMLVEKINWIAVQQINLIAITAMTEASWSGFAHSNIPVLAQNIRQLAKTITQVENTVIEQLVDIGGLLTPLEKPIQAHQLAQKMRLS